MQAVSGARTELPIAGLRVGAFRIPTDAPESDGTLAWDATMIVVVEVNAADDESGLGYTYADATVARLIVDHFQPLLLGRDAMGISALGSEMRAALRNLGAHGLSAMAVSAVDVALWDLKARHLGLPLATLLGQVRAAIPVYGSGGFTSYTDAQLREQFLRWSDRGIRRFKMKVGRHPERDVQRVHAARQVIGETAELFVDANSAYTRRQALQFAETFAEESDVRWLEEPLLPDDLVGLRFLRERAPAKLEIAEGEYGYDLSSFRRLLEAEAADVVMPDATRCGGITGFLQVATLCEAWSIPVSSHCAPALHVALGCALKGMRHVEYFHDHARIEHRLFDGAPEPRNGELRPSLTDAGLGLTFKWGDAAAYAA